MSDPRSGRTSIAALVRSGRPEKRIARIAAVTAGLAAAGAVVGGLVGAVMLTFIPVGPGDSPDPWAFLEAARLGGVVGATLGPAAAWLLMRHVPLGRAVGGTAAGTLGGAVLGLVAGGPPGSIVAAVCGFGAAAVYLRIRTPRRERRIGAAISSTLSPD